MNRLADRLLNDLLLGITTVTPRARYYSFYAWAVDQIVRTGGASTARQFRKAFTNLERIFMLACVAHEEESGKEKERDHNDINGSFKGWEVWKKNRKQIPLDFSYFGNMLGGYGQYYRGAIASLGLTMMDKDDIHERPTELGRIIAEAFDKSARLTPMTKLQDKSIAAKVNFYRSGRKLCLCQLIEGCEFERDLLTRLFFGLIGGHNNPREAMRRHSLTLMLHLISEIKMTDDVWYASQDFMDACYFGQVWDRDMKRPVRVRIPRDLAAVACRWKVFRAHDYFAYATESILSAFLEFLDENPQVGGTLDQFVKRSTDQILHGEFSRLTQLSSIPNSAILDTPLTTIINHIAKNVADIENFTANMPHTSKEFDMRVDMKSNFNEFALTELLEMGMWGNEKNSRDANVIYYSWPALILAVFMRFYWRFYESDQYWKWILSHSKNDPSVARFVHDVDIKLKSNQSFNFRQFIAWFIERFVIDEANRVYDDKFATSIYSKPKRWFHNRGAAFVKEREYSARHRNFRFSSAISILRDLGLISFSNREIKVTSKGKKTLSLVRGLDR